MITVSINTKSAVSRLRRFGLALDRERLLRAVGTRLLTKVGEIFAFEGQPRWKPLSPCTVASGGKRTLQRTGKLRRSFGMRVEGDTVIVGSALELATLHHHGTRPYWIRPRSAKALRFMTQGGTKFRHVVRHPGLLARPLLPTKGEARDLAVEVVKAEVKRTVKESAS
jgi:phage gpG-like protein